MKKLLFTLRRVRGAIGSYQGPPGAPCTAPDVRPTPTDGSDGSPGEGKGLKVLCSFVRFGRDPRGRSCTGETISFIIGNDLIAKSL